MKPSTGRDRRFSGALLTLLLILGCQKKAAPDDEGQGGTAGAGAVAGTAGIAGGDVVGGAGGAGGSATGGIAGDAPLGDAGAGGSEGVIECGDGVVGPDEDCDGLDIVGQTCEGLGFGTGPLACGSDCKFAVTACAPGANCGNGRIDGAEQCDDGDDNSDSEPDACRVNCARPRCGDSVVDFEEGCDDGQENSDFRKDACRSDCRQAYCGDALIDTGEVCDRDKLGRATCEREGFTAGELGCTRECTLDTSACFNCGDGTADGGGQDDPGYEDCDSADLRGRDCTDFGFVGGRLGCSFSCEIDTAQCGDDPTECGNDTLETGETCDGSDLDDKTCADFGFTGGRLACENDCMGFDIGRCNTCGNGTLETGEVCDDGNSADDFTCAGDCRADCGIGFGECNGDTSTFCGFDRSGDAVVQTQVCDPLQGLSCMDGLCQGACAVSALGSSYFGCDYYPVVTNNNLLVTATGDFAVVVANSGSVTANITVTKGAATIGTYTATPGDLAVIVLPWVTQLKAAVTALVVDGSYRVRTDQPVTVYQYNPLNYSKNGVFTYTNDASLLLPTNTWTGNYVVVARNHFSSYPGFYAVVAKEDDTEVTLIPSATGGRIVAGAGVSATGTGTVTLNESDVLHVGTASGGGTPDISDVTGTRIQASKPVQVIGGHSCTYIPYSVAACDHLEEAMLPIETLGTTYIVSSPLISTTAEKARMVRVTAVEANTTLAYDPPQAGVPTTLANAGDYFEVAQTLATFQIAADRRVIVSEYLMGEAAGGGTGDPAMVLAVPVQQFRTHYLFHAPTNYEANYVNITALTGTTVTLDSMTVVAGTRVGSTGYEVMRVRLDNTGNGNHVIDASGPFGISVYGYGQYTSYWYPGGLELTQF
jgi:hypothetical protein